MVFRVTYSAYAFAQRRRSRLTFHSCIDELNRKRCWLDMRRYIVPFVAVQVVLIIGLLILLLYLRAQ